MQRVRACGSELKRFFDRAERAWPGRFEELCKKTVTCIGAGAIGSYVCYRLAAAGVGRLYIIDGDVVEEHNLERTTCFTLSDVGKPKAEALRNCILSIRPWAEVVAVSHYLEELRKLCLEGDDLACGIIDEAFGEADLIFVGVDNAYARDLATRYAIEYGKPYVEAAFGPDHGEVYIFPNPREGPCRICTLVREDYDTSVLGYNLTAVCPSCRRHFKIKNWATEFASVEGGVPVERVFERGVVVAVKARCPHCGAEHTYSTPNAPAAALSEIAAITLGFAYFYAVRALLGYYPPWNVLRVFPAYVETAKLAKRKSHDGGHIEEAMWAGGLPSSGG